MPHSPKNGNEPLIKQPKWRLEFIKLHSKAILEYAAAPCNRRIDCTYCLVKWQYTWDQFDITSKHYLEAQNFPFLPADKFCTKKYFLSSLCHAITLYTRVPNIACHLPVKFARTLILCIEVFSKKLPHNRPWEIMLEGNQYLAFDL